MTFAHSRNAEGRRQALLDHLLSVADLCSAFCEPLGAQQVGRALGLWHDVGKMDPAFQAYLLASEADQARRGHGPDHKAAGALLAKERLGLLALLIQAHHGGLRTPAEFTAWLQEHAATQGTRAALQAAQALFAQIGVPTSFSLPERAQTDPLAADLFLRLLFSALVDADYLDTEAHFQGQRAAARTPAASLRELWQRFERSQQALSGRDDSPVNRARHAIYGACLAAAEREPGLFRLTVPTGGGKTRSAMGFALRHALRNGQERIILAIPYISITEQTADVYRSIFETTPGDPVVLEHHSGVTAPAADDDAVPSPVLWQRLAAENWDAPIIVTTTVQLFESLFADGPSRARKLHRLANSVILLDEAQALPPHLLTPILDGLAELARSYHSSVVFSTATQPAFASIPAFGGLEASEIVPQPERFFGSLQRVLYEWQIDPPLTWEGLAASLRAEPQVLVVLNTRKDALAVLDALQDPDALHLSTLLCGEHRRRVLAEVRARLQAGRPCRLVSTQVVEAGVDLDFPAVFRALGPLDSIIQAAGRCNREGRLARGRVVVFRPSEGGVPAGAYRTATDITRAVLGAGKVDPNAADAATVYFERLFDTVSTDREEIQSLRRNLNFPEVARSFRMIDEDSVSVAVPYGTADEQRWVQRLLADLRAGRSPGRSAWRALQPYLVNVRRREARRFAQEGLLSPIGDDLGEWCGRYDLVRGLSAQDVDPDALIV